MVYVVFGVFWITVQVRVWVQNSNPEIIYSTISTPVLIHILKYKWSGDSLRLLNKSLPRAVVV